MSNLGKLLQPGVKSEIAAVNFSNAVTISSAGGSLTAHGPLVIGGQQTVAGVSAGAWASANSAASSGLLAANYSPQFATGTGSAVTTAGALYLAQLPLLGATNVTNLWFSIATGAVTPTTNRCFGGLYTSAGVLVAKTGDLATPIGTNTGFIKCPLSAVYTVPLPGGIYYAGFIFTASTQPVLSCYTGQVTVTSSVANMGSATTFGNTAATYPFAVSATGSNTALPASITMASNTATGAYTFWAGAN